MDKEELFKTILQYDIFEIENISGYTINEYIEWFNSLAVGEVEEIRKDSKIHYG